MTTLSTAPAATFTVLDEQTRSLVRVAAVVAAGDESAVREALAERTGQVLAEIEQKTGAPDLASAD